MISPAGTLTDKTNVFWVVCFQDLLPDMKKSWPDLISPSSSGFWYFNLYFGNNNLKSILLDVLHGFLCTSPPHISQVFTSRLFCDSNIQPFSVFLTLSCPMLYAICQSICNPSMKLGIQIGIHRLQLSTLCSDIQISPKSSQKTFSMLRSSLSCSADLTLCTIIVKPIAICLFIRLSTGSMSGTNMEHVQPKQSL